METVIVGKQEVIRLFGRTSRKLVTEAARSEMSPTRPGLTAGFFLKSVQYCTDGAADRTLSLDPSFRSF